MVKQSMDVDNIGVAVLIENKSTGNVLLIKEEKTIETSNKREGNLSIIVGHVKVNETLIEAATREIKEESGLLDFKITSILKIFHFKKGHIVFLFHAITNQEIVEKAIWLSIEEIKQSDNLRPDVSEAITAFEKSERYDIDILHTV